MPDITMCMGSDCELKETCYRFLATPDTYQSYFLDPPKKDDGICEHYWEQKHSQAERLVETRTEIEILEELYNNGNEIIE